MPFKFELDRLTDDTTADIVNEIQRVADLLGLAPLKKREFDKESKVHSSNRPPSKVGGEAYIRRFGTWMKALAAFVERVNAEPDSAPSPTPSSREVLSNEKPSGPINGTRDEKTRRSPWFEVSRAQP